MSEPLKLPERVRKTLQDSYTDLQEMNKEFSKELAKAQKALNASVTIAIEMLGLDPSLNHNIDFATGIITPVESPAKPTLVKEEATG